MIPIHLLCIFIRVCTFNEWTNKQTRFATLAAACLVQNSSTTARISVNRKYSASRKNFQIACLGRIRSSDRRWYLPGLRWTDNQSDYTASTISPSLIDSYIVMRYDTRQLADNTDLDEQTIMLNNKQLSVWVTLTLRKTGTWGLQGNAP